MSRTIEAESVIGSVHEILKTVTVPNRHSFFQIEKFIIGKEPTGQGKLWQIIRELDARMDTFDDFQRQIEDGEDDLEVIDLKIQRLNLEIKEKSQESSETHQLIVREHEVNIRKLERQKRVMSRSLQKVKLKIRSLVEEMAFLTDGFQKIKDIVGDLKPYDDQTLQQDLWGEKLLEEFNLRVLLGQRMDTEFVRTIMALNNDAPVKKHITAYLNELQNNMIERQRKVQMQNQQNQMQGQENRKEPEELETQSSEENNG